MSNNKPCPITPEEAWEFFSSPANLEEITPADVGFEITGPLAAKMFEGRILTDRVKIAPAAHRSWVTEIKCVDEGRSFVDEQRFGPYKFWQGFPHTTKRAEPSFPIRLLLRGSRARGDCVDCRMGETTFSRDRVELRFNLLGAAERHKTIPLDRLGRDPRGHHHKAKAISGSDLCQRGILKLRNHPGLHSGAAEPFFQITPKAAVLGRQQCRCSIEITGKPPFERLGKPGHGTKGDFRGS